MKLFPNDLPSRTDVMWSVFFTFLNVFDCLFTLLAVHRFGLRVEFNPLMRLCLQHGDLLFILVKLGIGTFASFFILRASLSRRVNLFGIVVCSIYFVTAISNLVHWYVIFPAR